MIRFLALLLILPMAAPAQSLHVETREGPATGRPGAKTIEIITYRGTNVVHRLEQLDLESDGKIDRSVETVYVGGRKALMQTEMSKGMTRGINADISLQVFEIERDANGVFHQIILVPENPDDLEAVRVQPDGHFKVIDDPERAKLIADTKFTRKVTEAVKSGDVDKATDEIKNEKQNQRKQGVES